jgi:hypothetical protein
VPSKHAELGLGGSSAGRTLGCPAWAGEVHKLPPELRNPSSPAAEEGTRLHEEIEVCLRTDTPALSVPAEQALVVFDDYCDAHGIEPEHIEAEVRVALDGIPGAWGTCDVVIDAPGQPLTLFDWKFGANPVDPVDNDQLQFYACGLVDAFADLSPEDPVRLGIIQPSRSPVLETWDTTVAALAAWKERFAAAVADDTTLATGPWCTYCPALARCPQHRTALLAPKPVIDDLPPDELGRLLTAATATEKHIAALREYALGQAEAGATIPGWKLVAKRAAARWTDTEDVLAWIRRRRLPLTELAPRTPLSPAKMRKYIEDLSEDIPDDIIDKTSSGMTLAPDSDRRPAYHPGFAAMAAEMSKRKE